MWSGLKQQLQATKSSCLRCKIHRFGENTIQSQVQSVQKHTCFSSKENCERCAFVCVGLCVWLWVSYVWCMCLCDRVCAYVCVWYMCVSVFSSVQFKMVSMCSGKPICTPSHLSGVSPILPLKSECVWCLCVWCTCVRGEVGGWMDLPTGRNADSFLCFETTMQIYCREKDKERDDISTFLTQARMETVWTLPRPHPSPTPCRHRNPNWTVTVTLVTRQSLLLKMV